MNILKKELVDKNSPAWVGFQHALLAMVSMWIFSSALSITWPDFFGFYFYTVRQEFMLVVAGTLLGTLLSAVVLFRILKKAENPQGILKASVVWFILFNISLLVILFTFSSPGTHYGKTATDNLLETLPLSLIMIIGFSLLSWPFLKKRNSTNQRAMPTGSQGFISPLLLALVAVLVVSGTYAYVHTKKQGNQFTTEVGADTEATSTAKTANWKTYRNEKYGFELKYPDINAHLKSVGGWTDNDEPKITSVTPFNYDECVLAGEGPGMNGSKITIAGREYCLITQFAKEPGPNGPTDSISSSYYEYISRIGNEDISIAFSASWGADGKQVGQEAQTLFEQILSTFKLSSSTAQTADLETSTPPKAGMLRYKSSLNFSIDYPEKWRIESVAIERFGSIEEAERVGGNHFSIYSYPEKNSYNPGGSVPQKEIKIEIWISSNIYGSLDEWIDSKEFQNILLTESMVINGKNAKKILYSGEGDMGKFTALAIFYLDSNKKAKFFSYPSDTKYSQEFDAIVKTFRFTN